MAGWQGRGILAAAQLVATASEPAPVAGRELGAKNPWNCRRHKRTTREPSPTKRTNAKCF